MMDIKTYDEEQARRRKVLAAYATVSSRVDKIFGKSAGKRDYGLINKLLAPGRIAFLNKSFPDPGGFAHLQERAEQEKRQGISELSEAELPIVQSYVDRLFTDWETKVGEQAFSERDTWITKRSVALSLESEMLEKFRKEERGHYLEEQIFKTLEAGVKKGEPFDRKDWEPLVKSVIQQPKAFIDGTLLRLEIPGVPKLTLEDSVSATSFRAASRSIQTSPPYVRVPPVPPEYVATSTQGVAMPADVTASFNQGKSSGRQPG